MLGVCDDAQTGKQTITARGMTIPPMTTNAPVTKEAAVGAENAIVRFEMNGTRRQSSRST